MLSSVLVRQIVVIMTIAATRMWTALGRHTINTTTLLFSLPSRKHQTMTKTAFNPKSLSICMPWSSRTIIIPRHETVNRVTCAKTGYSSQVILHGTGGTETYILRFDTTDYENHDQRVLRQDYYHHRDVGAAMILYNANLGESVFSKGLILEKEESQLIPETRNRKMYVEIATCAEQSYLLTLLHALRHCKEMLSVSTGHLVVQSQSTTMVHRITERLKKSRKHDKTDDNVSSIEANPLHHLYERVIEISKTFRSFQIVNISKKRNTELRELAKKKTSEYSNQRGELSFNSSESKQSVASGSVASCNEVDMATDNPLPKLPPSTLITLAEMSNPRIQIDSSKMYLLRFDGGSRGNPGLGGAGTVLYQTAAVSGENKEVWHGQYFVGSHSVTNNVAEYVGLLVGLWCAARMGVRCIHVQGDSDLIVKQINGVWQCKKKNLQPYWKEAREIRDTFQKFSIEHIPRAMNGRADELANLAMNEQITKL